MPDDDRFAVIGVADVDEQMKQRRAAERMAEEHIAYTRLNALVGDFPCVYVVVPETGRYREFSSTEGFRSFALPKEGMDFFTATREDGKRFVYPEDLERFLSLFTKEGVLSEVKAHGIYSLTYRLMIEGTPKYVQLKAAMVEEKEGMRLVVGINDIDTYVRQEKDYAKRLAQAQTKASVDALTGVRNRHAYLDAEEQLDQRITEEGDPEFAIVILDVNDLKKINDSEGHQAGDQYLRGACKIFCDTFKHSPVFRIGGDEFAVITQGSDYASIDQLLGAIEAHNQKALKEGGIVIACGMSKFEDDGCVAPVFERADQNMYDDKARLKQIGVK